MSHFSTELRVLLEKHGLSQNALHKKTRIGQSTLSRYLNDLIAPDWRMVEKIGRAFPDDQHRTRLIAAHARDVVHPSLADKISGAKRQPAPKHEWRDPRERMPAKLRAAYDALGAAGIEQDAVADFIIAFGKIAGRE